MYASTIPVYSKSSSNNCKTSTICYFYFEDIRFSISSDCEEKGLFCATGCQIVNNCGLLKIPVKLHVCNFLLISIKNT